MKYGVQLYSLRDMGGKYGLEAILKAVAEAGYDGVEFAGFYSHTPQEVKELLDKYNLEGVSAHISAWQVEENLPYIDLLGMKYVFNAGMHGELWNEKYPEAVEKHKEIVNILNKRGVEYGYHNHSHEYANGGDLVDKLTKDVPGLKIQLDLCWATHAGRNVVETMKGYEGRLQCIHVKECPETDPSTTPPPVVGEGIVDMQGAFNEAKRQGIEWAILEVESFNMPEEEYLKRSLENMKKF